MCRPVQIDPTMQLEDIFMGRFANPERLILNSEERPTQTTRTRRVEETETEKKTVVATFSCRDPQGRPRLRAVVVLKIFYRHEGSGIFIEIHPKIIYYHRSVEEAWAFREGGYHHLYDHDFLVARVLETIGIVLDH
jgi:hypothetical protein